MAPCLYKGRVFGLPHTTDTSALFYREDALAAIGVKPPTDLKDAWTWEQFGEINDKLLELKQAAVRVHPQPGRRPLDTQLPLQHRRQDRERRLHQDGVQHARRRSQPLTFIKGWSDKSGRRLAIWTRPMPNEDTDQFIRGTASMAILGQWNITYLDENIK